MGSKQLRPVSAFKETYHIVEFIEVLSIWAANKLNIIYQDLPSYFYCGACSEEANGGP
jgi:hypothetical protein